MTDTELFFSVIFLCVGFYAVGYFYCWLKQNIKNTPENQDDEQLKKVPKCDCSDSCFCDKWCKAKIKFTRDHGF